MNISLITIRCLSMQFHYTKGSKVGGISCYVPSPKSGWSCPVRPPWVASMVKSTTIIIIWFIVRNLLDSDMSTLTLGLRWCCRDWQVTSYGGQLTYTVLFEVPRRTPSEGLVTADVRLEVCQSVSVWLTYWLSDWCIVIVVDSEATHSDEYYDG